MGGAPTGLEPGLGSGDARGRRQPTHIDSHHNVHRDPRALPFLDLAREYGMPLGEHSPALLLEVYGQWSGKTHLEQMSAESLARMLQTEVTDSVTELSCHSGHVDAEYVTATVWSARRSCARCAIRVFARRWQNTGFSSSVITIFPSCWPMPPRPAEIHCPPFAPLHPMSFLDPFPRSCQ